MPENLKKQKAFSLKKIFFVLFFAVSFSFFPVATKEADAWMAVPAELIGQAMTYIQEMIKGMMMGSLQQAALKMISKQADRFVSGVSGNGARFITNWEDYLVRAPQRNAQRYANDYISQALSGRGGSGYRSAGSILGASTSKNASEGFGKEAVLGDAADITSDSGSDYPSVIRDMADNIVNAQAWQLTYAEDPTHMFESDSLKNMNLYLMGDGNGGNTPWDAELAVSQEYQAALDQEKATATAMSIANQGFISGTSETANGAAGLVTKPGILYKELQANVENLPNLAITGAQNVGQLVAATVSSAISGMFKQAISGVENTVNREVNKVTDKAAQQVNKKVNAYGPGALYK